MSNKLKSKEKQKEAVLSVMIQFLKYLLDTMISIYMVLIIVVMPFYNEQGFVSIGSDKAAFFGRVSVYGARLLAPALVLYLLLCGISRLRKYGAERKLTETHTHVTKGIQTKTQKRGTERNLTGARNRVTEGESSGIQTQRMEQFGAKLRKICRGKISVTDIFALLYGISLVLSYLCSDYRQEALWGANKWYMGFIPQMMLLLTYFLISRFWIKKNGIFLLFLPVSAIVFALGYLNRFGIFPIDMKVENASFISTIGNINWYCGYLVSVFFGGYFLLWQSDRIQEGKRLPKKILLMLYVAVGFASLVTQGSTSGLVALAVIFVITFCLSVSDGRKMRAFWEETLILSLVCLATLCIRTIFHGQITYEDALVDLLTYSMFPLIATIVSLAFLIGISYSNAHGTYPVILFRGLGRTVGIGTVAGVCIVIGMIVLNTLRPGSLGGLSENPFFTFSADWGSNRGATWMAGWRCFSEQNLLHKLIGVGPDGMSAYLYMSGPADLIELLRSRFGYNTLTNAHNEWLTVLVNTGVLGCVSFVGVMLSAMIRFIKQGIQGEGLPQTIMGACGFCLLAYTVNNLFSFQQSMSAATIFVILGIGEAYAGHTLSFFFEK